MKEYKTPYVNTKLVMKIMKIIYEKYNAVELYCNSELEIRSYFKAPPKKPLNKSN